MYTSTENMFHTFQDSHCKPEGSHLNIVYPCACMLELLLYINIKSSTEHHRNCIVVEKIPLYARNWQTGETNN